MYVFIFFFQAEDGIRDLVRSRGLGDVYKRQVLLRHPRELPDEPHHPLRGHRGAPDALLHRPSGYCLLYTSDAADERSSVDLGGRRIIKKKKKTEHSQHDILIENTQQSSETDSYH
mgnify:CR=1 FL=1